MNKFKRNLELIEIIFHVFIKGCSYVLHTYSLLHFFQKNYLVFPLVTEASFVFSKSTSCTKHE